MRKAPSTELTQRHLADACNVSYVTVNRALSGNSAVSASTRRRVKETADRLGYRVNHIARSLKTKRTFSIGMIGCNAPHSFWSNILAKFEVRCRAEGYHVMVCHRLPGESSDRCAEFLIGRRVDGIVIAPDDACENPETLKRILAGTAVLFLNSTVAGIPSVSVGTNSRDGMQRMAEYLIGLGHRDLCYITGPACDFTGRQRLEGFQYAVRQLEHNGIACKVSIKYANAFCQEDGAEIAKTIISAGRLPTAIVCGNDALAIGVSLELARSGVRIPEDVSVSGYAGMSEGALLRAPLTTVEQPVFELGELCAKLIIERIDNPDGLCMQTELEDKLVVRESTGAPVSQIF